MEAKVWVVSELYYPETTSTGHFLTRIAEGLAKYYRVNVVCSQPTYSARGTRAPGREIKASVNIHRAYSPLLDKNVLVFRLLNVVFFSCSVLWRLCWGLRSSDVVIVVTNPPTLPYITFLASFVRRAKCVLLVHDVYPEVLVATGVIRKDSLATRILEALSRKLYEAVSAIVVIGRDMERLIRHKIGDDVPAIVEVIPNWADLDEIQPRPRCSNPFLSALGFTDKFVVQYSGNMGRTHGLEYILSAACVLVHDDKIRFLFVGEGARREWLSNEIARLGLNNTTLLPLQARGSLNDSLNAADVSVISFLPGMAGISVPSRMYNIFAAGKPVIAIADEDSELAIVVREEEIGWVVPTDHTDSLSTVVQKACLDRATIQAMGERARHVAESKYTFEIVIAKYRQLIQRLQNQPAETAYTTRLSS